MDIVEEIKIRDYHKFAKACMVLMHILEKEGEIYDALYELEKTLFKGILLGNENLVEKYNTLIRRYKKRLGRILSAKRKVSLILKKLMSINGGISFKKLYLSNLAWILDLYTGLGIADEINTIEEKIKRLKNIREKNEKIIQDNLKYVEVSKKIVYNYI
jgi:hypothetical protein